MYVLIKLHKYMCMYILSYTSKILRQDNARKDTQRTNYQPQDMCTKENWNQILVFG